MISDFIRTTVNRSGCVNNLVRGLSHLGFTCQSLAEVLNIRDIFPQIIQDMDLRIRQEAAAQINPLLLHRENILATRDRRSIRHKITLWLRRKKLDIKIARLNSMLNRSIRDIQLYESHVAQFFRDNAPTLTGARGEEQVIGELAKLPPDYIVANDFQFAFQRAIYWRKFNQYIRSVQIDHLILSRHGIFLIETKTRSQRTFQDRQFSHYPPTFRFNAQVMPCGAS